MNIRLADPNAQLDGVERDPLGSTVDLGAGFSRPLSGRKTDFLLVRHFKSKLYPYAYAEAYLLQIAHAPNGLFTIRT